MSNSNTPEQAAMAAMKDTRNIRTLSTGYRAILKAVPAPLIDKATSRIKDPVVPTFFNKEAEREEENPNHPAYRAALEEADRQRGLAGMDVMIVAGVDLVDPIPDDSEWVPKLKMLQRLGHLDLSEYDLTDALDREFVFKKFVAVAQDDYTIIARHSGVSSQEIAQAERSFPSN